MYTNLHTHTIYCDGKNTAEEMVIEAINKNFRSIGISSHAPLSFYTDWNMPIEKIDQYIDEINDLKDKYKNKINIFLGMEIDYFKDTEFNHIQKNIIEKLDYYIGSVHFLGKMKNNDMWTVDYIKDEFINGVKDSFDGDMKAAIRRYYNNISEMAIKYEPTIIGHFDVIKKTNKDNILFDENEDWYREIVEKTLDNIKKTNSVIEINTGGMLKNTKEQYPSTFILEMIKEKEIPIVVNSDAHEKNMIMYKFDDMYKLLKYIGFTNILELTYDGWKNIKI